MWTKPQFTPPRDSHGSSGATRNHQALRRNGWSAASKQSCLGTSPPWAADIRSATFSKKRKGTLTSPSFGRDGTIPRLCHRKCIRVAFGNGEDRPSRVSQVRPRLPSQVSQVRPRLDDWAELPIQLILKPERLAARTACSQAYVTSQNGLQPERLAARLIRSLVCSQNGLRPGLCDPAKRLAARACIALDGLSPSL